MTRDDAHDLCMLWLSIHKGETCNHPFEFEPEVDEEGVETGRKVCPRCGASV